jgi:tetratricopeptide (TPR) repeat protein
MRILILPLLCIVLNASAQSFDQLYEQGRTAYSSKEYSKAIDYYTQASQVRSSPYAYWGRANCYWQLFQYQKAIDDYTKALAYIDNEKDKSSLYENRGDCYFFLDNYEEASKDYKSFLAISPTGTRVHNQLGRCYLGMKKFDLAEACFNDAFALSTNSKDKAVYKYNLGYAKKQTLNYPAAEAFFTEAIALDPTYTSAYSLRAVVYKARKKYNLAAADYEELIRLEKTESYDASYYHSRGLVYWEMGNKENAFADLKKATELDPVYDNYWYDLGRFMKTSMNNATLAATFLQKAMEIAAKEKEDTGGTYTYALFFSGKQTAAIAMQHRRLNAAKGDEYDWKWALHNMGCVYALAGEKTKAIDYIGRSLAAGYDDYQHLLTDRDLRSLMELPQWKAMLAKYNVPKLKL